MKKALSLLLALAMILSLAACNNEPKPTLPPDTTAPASTAQPTDPTQPSSETEPAAPPTYTFHDYSTTLGTNWNPHTWENSGDSAILDYISSPFCTMQAKDTENGVYQWVYEMATEINDVTATHQDDLVKYGASIGNADPATVDKGFVFEIKLNPNAKWENGTPINADTYIYSMKALLDWTMKNYRANLYYGGESALAGAFGYFNNDLIGTMVYNNLTSYPDAETYYFAEDKTCVFFGDTTSYYYNLGYVDYYKNEAGEDLYKKLAAVEKNKDGYAVVTEEMIADMLVIAQNFGDKNPEAWKEFCFAYVPYEGEFVDFEQVGLYKVDDYTLIYVCQEAIDFNYFLTSCTSTWLVYEDLYEANKEQKDEVIISKYGTSKETSMSYGPYRIESLQKDKQIVYVQNENWYGYEKQADGTLLAMTPYEVNGEHVQRYQTTKIVVDVMTDDAAKQAFLKGDLDGWTPPADDVPVYAKSEQLYKADETYTESFFFHTNLEDLKKMDESKGNKNSVVVSNYNFRKAFSYAIDRTEWVTATAGYKPNYGLMNNLYHYDFYNDPNSSYRSSDQAMQAICDLYGVSYGAGTPYATLKDAYKSITGYNLTLAKELMAQACKELVEAGIYTAGEEIKIRIGYKKGALDSSDNKQVELMNKYINAAAEGSGFGKITLEAVGNVEKRYDDVIAGEYAFGYGAWGGAALYPFRNFRVYCDPDYTNIHEAGCWDPTTERLTINVNGEDVTMTWQQWSNSMTAGGPYADSDFDTKLYITATMEKEYLAKYYRIPLATSTACFLLGYKCSYITEDYNLAYGWGGLELMTYNYNDAEWADFVKSSGGTLSYE